MNDIKILIDIIGWIGALSLLSAYLLISSDKLDAKSFAYQGLNLLGSFCLIGNTLYYGTYALVFLNSIWALIGLNAIRQILTSRNI